MLHRYRKSCRSQATIDFNCGNMHCLCSHMHTINFGCASAFKLAFGPIKLKGPFSRVYLQVQDSNL